MGPACVRGWSSRWSARPQSLAAAPARALDKQGSAHGGGIEGPTSGFDFSGSASLGVSLYNPTYAARPDNTGLALFRYAGHFDFDLIGRRLSIPLDINMFTDRRRSASRASSCRRSSTSSPASPAPGASGRARWKGARASSSTCTLDAAATAAPDVADDKTTPTCARATSTRWRRSRPRVARGAERGRCPRLADARLVRLSTRPTSRVPTTPAWRCSATRRTPRSRPGTTTSPSASTRSSSPTSRPRTCFARPSSTSRPS